MIHEADDACCERICTYVIACERGIPFAWNTPLERRSSNAISMSEHSFIGAH